MHRWDWLEALRRWLLPRLGFTGYVDERQYVGTLEPGVEAFEEVLHHNGITRNAFAYFKHEHGDGDLSVGSWVWLPDGFFGTWQEHLTVFADGSLYVHREYNWRRHPIKHLRELDMSYPVQRWRQRLHDWGVGYDVIVA